VISNLAGVSTPPVSVLDCSKDINTHEPSWYEGEKTWNLSTQETMLAVEAALYVQDNYGTLPGPELWCHSNRHYEMKVKSAVRDGTGKVGGAAEADVSIHIRTAGEEGKDPKKQVYERMKYVRREIFRAAFQLGDSTTLFRAGCNQMTCYSA